MTVRISIDLSSAIEDKAYARFRSRLKLDNPYLTISSWVLLRMITMTSTESDRHVVFQRSSCDAVPGRKVAIDLTKVRIPISTNILAFFFPFRSILSLVSPVYYPTLLHSQDIISLNHQAPPRLLRLPSVLLISCNRIMLP